MAAKLRNLSRLTSVTGALAVALTQLLAVPAPGAAAKSPTVAGLPAMDGLRLGERMYREARQKLRQSPPQEMVLGPETGPGADFWRGLGNRYQGAIILLWLAPGDLSSLDAMAALPVRPASLFASAGLLGGTLASIPEPVRDFTYLTYPSRLPSDEAKHMAVVKSWLRVKNIPEGHLEIQSRMYFAGWLLSNALMMMGSDNYRDYFLDGIDMMNEEVYAIANYPRLSFGQGQRYAAKGCYVVQLGAGTEPAVIPRSDWVFH